MTFDSLVAAPVFPSITTSVARLGEALAQSDERAVADSRQAREARVLRHGARLAVDRNLPDPRGPGVVDRSEEALAVGVPDEPVGAPVPVLGDRADGSALQIEQHQAPPVAIEAFDRCRTNASQGAVGAVLRHRRPTRRSPGPVARRLGSDLEREDVEVRVVRRRVRVRRERELAPVGRDVVQLDSSGTAFRGSSRPVPSVNASGVPPSTETAYTWSCRSSTHVSQARTGAPSQICALTFASSRSLSRFSCFSNVSRSGQTRVRKARRLPSGNHIGCATPVGRS